MRVSGEQGEGVCTSESHIGRLPLNLIEKINELAQAGGEFKNQVESARKLRAIKKQFPNNYVFHYIFRLFYFFLKEQYIRQEPKVNLFKFINICLIFLYF